MHNINSALILQGILRDEKYGFVLNFNLDTLVMLYKKDLLWNTQNGFECSLHCGGFLRVIVVTFSWDVCDNLNIQDCPLCLALLMSARKSGRDN